MASINKKATPKKKVHRKKRMVRHANPLFEKWLAEWEKEAADVGSNMKFNYRRARNALKLYPLPVYKGSDCRLLNHFGDKLCQMLERRLQKHVDENGPVIWEEVHQVIKTPATKKRVRKKTASRKEATAKNNDRLVQNSPESDLNVSASKRGKGRPYVPAFRSGAYALLVTLYNNTRGDCDFMKKAELMEAAQPLSNSSFSQAPDGSHYTAWSSMSILIKKDLVERQGCPAKYSITGEGKALAMKLLSAGHPGSLGSLPAPPQASSDPDVVTLSSRTPSPCFVIGSPAKKGKKKAPRNQGSGSSINEGSSKGGSGLTLLESPRRTAGSLIFSYVTSLEMETPLKAKALVSTEDDGFVGFLIKCRLTPLLSSSLSYRIDDDRLAPLGFVYAYLSDECAPEQSPGLLSPTMSKAPSGSKRPIASDSKSSAKAPAKVPRKRSKPSSSGYSSKSGDTPSTAPSQGSLASTLSQGSVSSMESNKSPVSLLDVIPHSKEPKIPRTVESHSSARRTDMDILSHCSFSLFPGQYEVVLCIDNCETKGGFLGVSKFNTKEIIINELDKHKIRYDVRKLHVGDFLWVIREHSTHHIGSKESRELVLPYIVERKRMDDLASSIRDGRFKEQKFRLKQFSFAKPVYLVEEYGTQNLSIPEATCLQAITNTQIVDGFTVKITKDQQESAAFLTIMTRCLQSRYQGKTVRSLTSGDMKKQDLFTHGVDTALMTFEDFNSLAMKNHQLPVKEMFAKHLLQLSGLSVEKVKAVVDKYGTPAELISAYESLDPADCEHLLSSLKCGKTARNFGPSLSSTVARCDEFNETLVEVARAVVMAEECFFKFKIQCDGRQEKRTESWLNRIKIITKCSKIYCDGVDTELPYIRRTKQVEEPVIPQKKSKLSNVSTFSSQLHCIFCVLKIATEER